MNILYCIYGTFGPFLYLASSPGPKWAWYTLFAHALNPLGIQVGLDTLGTRPDTLTSL